MRSKRAPHLPKLLSQLLLTEPDDAEPVAFLSVHPARDSVVLSLHGGETVRRFRLEARQARDLAALLLIRRGAS